MSDKFIYVTPRGWRATEMSNSQYGEYMDSPAKFYWRRVRGFRERKHWATTQFGHAIQFAIQNFYKGQDPVESFMNEWQRILEEDHDLIFSATTNPDKLRWQGVGLMKQFRKDARAGLFPVTDPAFLTYQDRLKMFHPGTGCYYTSIPDLLDEDAHGRFVADIKALDHHPLQTTTSIVVMDRQLRTQAAVSGICRVALWVFARSPFRADPPSLKVITDTVMRAMPTAAPKSFYDMFLLAAVREILDLTIPAAGELLGMDDLEAAMRAKEFVKHRKICGEQNLWLTTSRAFSEALVELEKSREPIWSIKWTEGEMTMRHALAAVDDQMSIIPQIQAGHFPCRCSVRWPNDTANDCQFRGLCLEKAVKDPTSAQIEEWRKITEENLKPWDADDMSEEL